MKNYAFKTFVLGAAILTMPSAAASQVDCEPIRFLGSFSPDAQATVLHDFDGDGEIDILLGDPGSSLGGADSGRLSILSAQDGSVLWFRDGLPGDKLGQAVTQISDLNGDSVPEFAASAPGALNQDGQVLVFSGSNGILSFTIDGSPLTRSFGDGLYPLGDTDGDGYNEIGIGYENGEHMAVYSIAADKLLYALQWVSFAYNQGDVNGDGLDDILTNYIGGFGDWLFMYSGADGASLWGTYSDTVGFPIEDRTGDLIPDVWGFATSYQVIDGATGQIKSDYPGIAGSPKFIWQGNDLDRDDHPDLLTTDWRGGIQMVSTIQGRELWSHYADGILQAPYPDANGDGLDDFLTISNSTELWLIAGLPGLRLSANQLSASAHEAVDLILDFADGSAGSPFIVLASDGPRGNAFINGFEIFLSESQLLAKTLAASPLPGTSGFWGQLDGNGDATASIHSGPRYSALIGTEIWFCAVLYDTIGAIPIGRLCSLPDVLLIEP